MTGAQKVEYAFPAFIAARASMPIARPVARHSERLNAMPVVIGKAKLVVETSCAPWLPLATPWDASLHQSYFATARAVRGERAVRNERNKRINPCACNLRFSEGTAGELVPSCVIFSATVMMLIMLATRAAMGSVALHHGRAAWPLVALRHGFCSIGGGGT